jgi:hypothetical protein
MLNLKFSLVLLIILQSTLSEPDSECWVKSYGRGAGNEPIGCPEGHSIVNGTCLKNCLDGYKEIQSTCWLNCPKDFRDDGAYCFKPESYHRGTGYALTDEKLCLKENSKYGCERTGWIYYKKCQEGYFVQGCCNCSPTCPPKMIDLGNSCGKDNYEREVYDVPCMAGLVKNTNKCFSPCESGFKRYESVCLGSCPKDYTQCGVLCIKGQADCPLTMENSFTDNMAAIKDYVESFNYNGGDIDYSKIIGYENLSICQ